MAFAYTPVGPFTDNSSTPPVSAGFLNGVETALGWGNPIVGPQYLTSGASFGIPLPASSAGLIMIHGSSGGGWHSGYVGAWTTSASATMITQLNTQTLGPGNVISAVNASSTATSLNVATTPTGAQTVVDYVIIRGTL